MTKSKKITVAYDELKSVTQMAYLATFAGRNVWLPKSQITFDEETKTLEIPYWLAVDKEIEMYEDEEIL